MRKTVDQSHENRRNLKIIGSSETNVYIGYGDKINFE